MAGADKEYESSNGSLPSLAETDQSFDDSMYKYRDFATVSDEEIEQKTQTTAPSPPPTGPRGSVESSIRVQKFPVKLYVILAQKEFHDIITWMPHGRSWKVLKPSLFESLVMPLFFEYSNYHSFNRLVNAWSFRRISAGPDRGSYYHELFLRGRPSLHKSMRRLPKTHKKLPMKKEDEPDFYTMDKANPLPPLDEISGSIMRQPQNLGSCGGALLNQMAPTGVGSSMGGMSAFEPMDPLMGIMGQQRPQSSAMGLNSMPQMNSMNVMSGMNMMNSITPMNNMASMNGMGSINGMGLNNMHQMNTMNGMNTLRESSGFVGSNGNSIANAGDFDFQRFRQLQQMQLFERQMSGGSPGMSGLNNDSPSTNFRLRGQQC